MSSLLEINNLSIQFPSKTGSIEVVHNLNLSLQTGEILGIVGESGSGKSVSLLSVTRLIDNAILQCESINYRKDNGEIVDLSKLPEDELRSLRGNKIAYIFQEPMTALHPLFTCGQQLLEGIECHQSLTKEEARKKAIDLFEEMDLPNPERVFGSYPHQLSGGQRQRVMIAMALANDPDILIADEPTTALDSVLQKKLTKHMVDICRKRNTGLLLISHDLQLIKDFTDRVLVMYKGNTIEQGITSEVVEAPKSIYTQSLLQCQPSIEKHSMVLPTIHELADYENGTFIPKTFVSKRFEFQPIETKPIIEIEHISKTFRKGNERTNALVDVSFDIYKGETLGLIGESGCGKSTLSKVIIQLLNADAGRILYNGEEATSNRKTFAKKVQMVFQDPYSSLNPSMKVGDILSEPIIVHKLVSGKSAIKKAVESLLEEVGLTASDYGKYPHEFSGGQRQRISIARALAVEPDLIICDESVSALDISVQAQILNLFNELKSRRQLTYLFISHDLKVVSYICDRIIEMKEGRLLDSLFLFPN